MKQNSWKWNIYYIEFSHDIYLLWLYYYSTKNYQLSSIYFVILTFKLLKKKEKIDRITISGKYSLNTFDCLDNYMWLQRALAITKAHLQLCYSERRKSNLFFEFAYSKVMFTWRVHWFISEIKAGHWFISWYIFTDWISDYFTDSGLESTSFSWIGHRSNDTVAYYAKTSWPTCFQD